jgi:hypothetical protein
MVGDQGTTLVPRATQFAGIFGQLSESWEDGHLGYQFGPLTKLPIFLVPGCGTFD